MKSLRYLLLPVGLLFSFSLFAQFNFAVHYEAHRPFLQAEDRNTITTTGAIGQNRTYEQNRYSFGAGKAYGASLGYRFRQNFIFGLEMTLLNGEPQVGTFESPVTFTQVERKGQTLRAGVFIQSLLPINKKRNLSIYNRLGISYASNTKVSVRQLEENLMVFSSGDELELAYTGGKGSSVAAGLGLRYGNQGDMFLQIGVKGVFQQYRPERRDYELVLIGGDNILPNLSTYERTTVYESTVTNNFSSPITPSEPRQQLPIVFPFSSLGLEVLVGFEF